MPYVGRSPVGNFKRGHDRARHHIHTLDFGKFCGDFISHAVAEVGAVLLGAEILEGKHGDGWPSGGSSRTYGGILAIPEHADDGYKRGEADACDVHEAARCLSCDGRRSGIRRVVEVMVAAGNFSRRGLLFEGIDGGLNG
jgi:hypothetical protein